MTPPDTDFPVPEASRISPASDDRLAADLRGFGPLGILAMVVILLAGGVPVAGAMIPLGGLLTLTWVRLSRTPWREIGYVRPANWIATIAGGVVLGVAFKFFMKAIVMPLLGADPINHAFHYLTGNWALIPATVFTMVVGAGFGEETVFRGFLFERLGRMFGKGPGARVTTVLLTAVLFGFAHWSLQGLAGTEQAAIVGLVFGTIYARTGRIWLLMVTHAAFDLTAYAMIYWDLETRVAHLLFK